MWHPGNMQTCELSPHYHPHHHQSITITIINPDPLNESLITMVTGETEVKRKASCVGGVEGKPKLARARIASSLVDASAHEKNKMKYLQKTAEQPPFLTVQFQIFLRPLTFFFEKPLVSSKTINVETKLKASAAFV